MYVFIGITTGIVLWLFLGNIVGFDKTPWPLLLTILNLPQLSIMISLQVSANRAQAASDRRAIADHETLIALHEMAKQQLDILNGQDRVRPCWTTSPARTCRAPAPISRTAWTRSWPRSMPNPRPADDGELMDRSRLEAFSDGVFAVAITLLALDLTVEGPGHGASGRSAPRQLAGLPGLPDQLLHDRHHVGQPPRPGQVHHQGGPAAAVPQPGAAAVRRADPVRHRHRGGLLPANTADARLAMALFAGGVPRHVGRLRRDLRVDAARRARSQPLPPERRWAARAALRRRRAGLRASPSWSRRSTPSPRSC